MWRLEKDVGVRLFEQVEILTDSLCMGVILR